MLLSNRAASELRLLRNELLFLDFQCLYKVVFENVIVRHRMLIQFFTLHLTLIIMFILEQIRDNFTWLYST